MPSSRSGGEIERVRVKAGARIHAVDSYWPYTGRPIRKDRIVSARLVELTVPKPGVYWEWIDPKALRARWAEEKDVELLEEDMSATARGL